MIKLPSLASTASDYERDPLWPRPDAGGWQPSGNWGVPQVPRPAPFARPTAAPLPTGESLRCDYPPSLPPFPPSPSLRLGPRGSLPPPTRCQRRVGGSKGEGSNCRWS